MNLNFVFKSSDHLKYQNGRHISGPHGGAARAVKVEPNIIGCEGYNIEGGIGYIVTIYNIEGNHPVWNSNIQMAPKPMKIITQSLEKVVLRGFLTEAMSPFGWIDFNGEDFGLSIIYKNEIVDKCILHLHDSNTEIEYIKSDDQTIDSISSQEVELEQLSTFLNRFRSRPNFEKITLTGETDKLNNIGCKYYKDYDLENAIIYFNMALEKFPINTDALNNLIICYRETCDFMKMEEAKKKYDYLKKLGL